MNLKDFSGYIYYKGKEYIFTFSNYVLRLLPKDSNQLITFRVDSVFNHGTSKNKEGFIKDIILEGLSIDGVRVFMCVQDYLKVIDNVVTLSVKWVYFYNGDKDDIEIKGIDFGSQEINYIYNVNRYIDTNYEGKEEKRVFTISINSKVRELLGTFDYEKNNVQVFGNIVWRKSYNVSNNLEVWSLLSLEFENEIKDLNTIYKIIILQKLVIDFLTYRTNNSFNNIEIYSYDSNNNKKYEGNFYISDDFGKEDDIKSVQHLIYSENIPNIGRIYKMIKEEKIYMSHICGSQKLKKIYNQPRILGILIAFERIINWKYDKEDLRNENYIKLIKKLKKLTEDNEKELCDRLNINKTKFQKYINSQLKPQTPFSTYITRAIKDYPVSHSLIANIYGVEPSKKLENQIADRVNKFRNDMAHGNMDIKINDNIVKDIKFVELLVYTIILIEIGLTEDEVINKISYLFNIRPMLILSKKKKGD